MPSEDFIGMTGLTLGWLLKETRLAIETNKKNRMTYLYGSEYIISLNISDDKNIEVTIGNGKNGSIIKSNEKIETFLETVINASKKISEISAGNTFGNTDVEIMLPDTIKSAEKVLRRIKKHG